MSAPVPRSSGSKLDLNSWAGTGTQSGAIPLSPSKGSKEQPGEALC